MTATPTVTHADRYADIPLDEIVPDPANLRAEPGDVSDIVATAKRHGILQPIVVRERADGPGYMIVMGERRYTAAREAGLETIPAIVKPPPSAATVARQQLIENIARRNMNHIEEALGLRRVFHDGPSGDHRERFGSQQQLADFLGVSLAFVSQRLALLDLPEDQQRRVKDGEMSLAEGAAMARTLKGRTRASSKPATGSRPLRVEPRPRTSAPPVLAPTPPMNPLRDKGFGFPDMPPPPPGGLGLPPRPASGARSAPQARPQAGADGGSAPALTFTFTPDELRDLLTMAFNAGHAKAMRAGHAKAMRAGDPGPYEAVTRLMRGDHLGRR